LSGEFGEALAVAMKVLVEVGEALGAERLIPVSHAHVSGISIFNIGVSGVELLEKLVSMNARVRVYTTANPYSMAIEIPQFFDEKIVALQRRVVELLTAMGIDESSFTCIPYALRRPGYGEHLAWAESSAVIYANSVLGARTNREGGIVALLAGIAGRTYEAGMHLDENRRPSLRILVEVPATSIWIASAIGLYVGSVSKDIPFVSMGIDRDPVAARLYLKNFLASVATTSSLPMVFIENVTPERIDEKELASLERVSIDRKEIENYIEERCSSTLLLGCPHLDLDEVRYVLRKLLTNEVSKFFNHVMIFVPRRFEVSDDVRNLIIELKRRGLEVALFRGCCPVVTDLRNVVVEPLATVHGKARHYIPKLAGVPCCLVNAL